MTAASSPAEARIKIEAALLETTARCERIRYFPYPSSDGRLVLVCAELDNGDDVRVLCRLTFPVAVNGSDYDEDAIRQQFEMPSVASH
jgi:hypothetical protein